MGGFYYGLDISSTAYRMSVMPRSSLQSAHWAIEANLLYWHIFWPFILTMARDGHSDELWLVHSRSRDTSALLWLVPKHRPSIISTITHHTMFKHHLLHFESELPRYGVRRYKPNTVLNDAWDSRPQTMVLCIHLDIKLFDSFPPQRMQ